MAEVQTVYRFRDPMAPPNAPALALYFRQEEQVNDAETKRTGIQTYDNVLYAVIAPMGMPKSNTTCEIERTLPDGTVKTNPANSAKYAEQIKLYRSGVESEAAGTPLKMLPGMNPATIANLKARGLHTVEMLADIQDGANQDFMGFFELRDKARTYVALREKEAPFVKIQAEMEDKDREIASLKRQMSELAALVEKRGPGRPRKDQQEAA